MFGRGSYDPDNWVTSKVFGIAGEALLNFGVYAMPFTYIIVGMVVGLVRRLVYGLDEDDMRRLLLPYLVNFCFMLIVSDFDNMIFNTFKSMFVPFVLIFLGSIHQTFITSVERG
jgi:energy-converting hydrogenase Eha subunit G